MISAVLTEFAASDAKPRRGFLRYNRLKTFVGCFLSLASLVHAASAADDYEFLLYLDSTGVQYINTGVTYARDTRLEQRYGVVNFKSAQMMMGAIDSIDGQYERFHWGVDAHGKPTVYVGKGGGFATGEFSDGWADVELNAVNLTVTINHGEPQGSGAAFKSNGEEGHSQICLFARNSSGTMAGGSFRIATTRIYKNDVLVRDFYPARRKSDGALGMYDRCEPRFYENDGEGDFTAGPVRKVFAISKLPDVIQSIDDPVESCPLPKVVDANSSVVLTKDVDYAVAWTDNERFGTGECTVTGLGQYANSWVCEAEFKTVPAAKLPSDYQRLLYLESTGGQFIDTDLHPTRKTRLTVVMQRITGDNETCQVAGILDVESDSFRRFHMTFKVDSIYRRLVFMPGVGLQEITTGKQIDQESPFDRHWNTLTMDRKNEKIAFNSTEAAMTPLSGDLPTVSGIRLFGRSSNTAQYIETGKVRIVDAALYEDDVKQHEFIPCRRKSDGVLGLYDVVGKRFYAKSEGCEEDFIPGPELHEEVRGLMILLR